MHSDLISQKVFTTLFCKSQFPNQSVHVSFIIINIRDKLTDLCGDRLLQNDCINTFCEKRTLFPKSCFPNPDPQALSHHHQSRESAVRAEKACTSNSTLYTKHPAPYTLHHHTPYSLHPTTYTLRHTPYTLHPSPYTLHPTPHTLHYQP